MKNTVYQLHELGQSIWLDFIDRRIIENGELKRMIEEDGIRGITSNPAIFEKAISSSDAYDADIIKLNIDNKSNEEIFFGLAIEDIQNTADLFKPVFSEAVKGSDGYVSLEVSPHFAQDTEATINQAMDLWSRVNRENLMVKIPGTQEGLPAIQKAISSGFNINVTLLFGLDRYKAVTEAYISGLEERLAEGKDISSISSVASFFLSRIDTLIDPLLKEKGLQELEGKTAIASAKLAYQIYKRVFSGERWQKLADKGAKPQRLLWASTSSKNPAFKDTVYVEALIGPDTVNTVPLETLKAYLDHGEPASRIEEDVDKATAVLGKIKSAGIDIDEITAQLEKEGIEKFNQPYDKLLNAIDKQKKQQQPA